MAAQRTSRMNFIWITVVLLLGIVALSTACSPTAAPQQCPQVDCPEAVIEKPMLYEERWALSAHADANAEPFNHWNETDPPEIPVTCAKCHSRPGFIDFLGIDGSTPGEVDPPAKIGTTITCYVCHNEVSLDLNSATFPSGVKIRNLGPEARCIQCHMGNASTTSVDKVITDLRLTEEDTPNAELAFINSHSISAATPFGSEVHGAYEYAGQTYTGRFMRGEDFFACNQCHDQHTLELQFDTCGQCHTINGSTPQDIRVKTNDFDGDGDIQEGIAFEIEYFREALLAAIQSYATKTSGVSIAYTAETYPYFFTDSNKNGAVDSDEATADNWYVNWTPRMLRAAYNYNYVIHDPGAFAHNSTYTLQILFDSLGNIGGDTIGLSRP